MRIVGEAITDEDKSALLRELKEMPLRDVTATIRRLAQMAARGNVLTGFTREDMEWLYNAAQDELDRRAKEEGRKPPEHEPLKWGEEDLGYTDEPLGEHMPGRVAQIRERVLKKKRKRTASEMRILAAVTGEINVEDVPLAPWADVAALQAGDDDPLQVVVEIPAGRSKRGWIYTERAIQRIVSEVMTQGLPGGLGHQKPEDVDHEFPPPVTHWVGAMWRAGRAYVRGVVDKSAADLKRWIRAKTVRTVSIFGIPALRQNNGETYVVDFQPLAIDWTPLGRAGMPTAVVALGEMDEIIGELDGSHEELRDALYAKVRAIFGAGDDRAGYVWVYKVFDGYFIAQRVTAEGTTYYRIPYLVDSAGQVQIGELVEVTRVETYKPVETSTGEMKGAGIMNWKELVAKLKTMLAAGEVTLAQIAGEMGWKAQQLAGEIDAAWARQATGAIETLARVREALGVTGEMDVVQAATDAAAAVKAKRKADHEKLVGEVLNEKVAGEMNQGLIRKLLTVQEGATREQIAGEIDKLLADESLKETFSRLHLDKPPAAGGGKPAGAENNSYLRTRTVAI